MVRSAAFAGFAALALAAGCGSAAGGGSGAEYPSKPVALIVPYPAGGPTDVAGRAMGGCLEGELSGTIVVQNKPGATGAVGLSELAQSKPDGYTLGVVSVSSMIVGPLFQEDVSYTKDDFQLAGMIYEIPGVFVVRADSPYQTAKQFFAAAKEKPGTVTVGIPGATNVYAIELDRMAKMYGIELKKVPFQGGGPAGRALLSGDVDAVFDAAAEKLLKDVETGTIRALATGAAERPPYLDSVPTLRELGYDKLVNSSTFWAIAGPARLPDSVTSTLQSGMRTCLQKDDVRRQLGEQYLTGEFLGPEAVSRKFDEYHQVYSELAPTG